MITGISFAFLSLIIAFVVTMKAIPAIIKVSELKGLIDKPDGDRKLHKNLTSNLGGVGLFAGFMIAYGISMGVFNPHYLPALIASVTILFFVGIKDDILVIAPIKKLIGQILAASVVVFLGNIYLPGLDGLFGIETFHPIAGKVFSVFAMVMLINSYNLIDGVDGLAGIIALVGSYLFGLWFLWGGHYAEAVLSFSMSGALLGFMFHNFEPAKIFMGDTGSLVIGFILTTSAFRLVQLNPTTPGLSMDAPVVFVFSVMIIPVFDTIRVIAIRLSKGLSPLKADANHMHHYLLRLGLRHYQVSLILAFSNLFIVLAGFNFQSANIYLYMSIVLFMASTILPILRGMKGFIQKYWACPVPELDLLDEGLLESDIMDDIMDDLTSKNSTQNPYYRHLVYKRMNEKEYQSMQNE